MSLEFAKLFQFLRKDTFFHYLDPRAKFIMVISFSILAFLYTSIIPLLILMSFLFFFIIISKQSDLIISGLKGLSFLILFILILNTWVYSLNFAINVILRLIVLMLVFSLYFQTTLPEDITQSLITIHFPYPAAFALSLAFRFVPTMANETEIVMDAQRSRGHKIKEGGIFQQIKNLFPLLIPLIVNSIRRAYRVAEALETRGFGQNNSPTFLYPLKMKLSDWFFVLINGILLGFGIFIYLNSSLIPSWWFWELTL